MIKTNRSYPWPCRLRFRLPYAGVQLREVNACDLLNHFHRRRKSLRQAANEIRCGRAAVAGSCSCIPNSHLIELDVADRLGRCFSNRVNVFEHQQLESCICTTAARHQGLQTLCLLVEKLEVTLGLGLHLDESGI